MSERHTLPSGMQVVFRGWSSNELVRLFEAAQRAQGDVRTPFYKQLGPAWLETVDAGPYDPALFHDTAKPVDFYNKLLFGDVLAAITFARQITLGDDFAFPVSCPGCGYNKGHVPVKLSELVVKPLTPEALAKVRAKEQFTGHVAGKVIGFDLASPGQDAIIDRLLADLRAKKLETRSHASTIERFAAQIRTIDGEALDPIARWKWVAGLGGSEFYDLRDVLAEHDCGLETGVDASCKECPTVWPVDVPLVWGRGHFWTRERQRFQPASGSVVV